MNRVVAEWRSLRTQVLEHRTQLKLSLRVTIAALAAYALSNLLGVPLPAWTVLTAIILTQVSFGRSIKATIDYLAGTIGGAVYAGAVAALIPQTTTFAQAGVLALVVAPLALVAAIVPRFSVATFTGVLVLLVRIGATPIESALDRVLEVTVGGLTALVVSLLVFPARAYAFAIEEAAQTLGLAAQSLPALFAGFTRASDLEEIVRIQEAIGEALARAVTAAADVRHERIGFLGAERDGEPLLRTLTRLRNDLVMIGRAAVEPLPETLQARLAPALAVISDTVADHLRRSGDALSSRRGPPSLDAAEAGLDHYAEAFSAIRSEGLTRALAIDAAERIFTLGFALDRMRQDLRDLNRCVAEAGGSARKSIVARGDDDQSSRMRKPGIRQQL
jgi:uncharacterized membrane protein YccC